MMLPFHMQSYYSSREMSKSRDRIIFTSMCRLFLIAGLIENFFAFFFMVSDLGANSNNSLQIHFRKRVRIKPHLFLFMFRISMPPFQSNPSPKGSLCQNYDPTQTFKNDTKKGAVKIKLSFK